MAQDYSMDDLSHDLLYLFSNRNFTTSPNTRMISNECTHKEQAKLLKGIGIDENTAEHIVLFNDSTEQIYQIKHGETYLTTKEQYSCHSYPSWSMAQLIDQLPLEIKLHGKTGELVIKPEKQILKVLYITKDNEIIAQRSEWWSVQGIINLLYIFRKGNLD